MARSKQCVNPNLYSDVILVSRLLELDSDSDSDLQNINPDFDSRKKWWIQIQIRILIKGTDHKSVVASVDVQ